MMTTQPTTLQTRKRKGGRPRLPASERRDYQFTTHYNQGELANLERRCQSAGLEIPTFIRLTSLGVELPKVVPQVNQQALLHLSKIGNLLNQIAHKLNAGADRSQQDLANIELASKALAALRTKIFDADSGGTT